MISKRFRESEDTPDVVSNQNSLQDKGASALNGGGLQARSEFKDAALHVDHGMKWIIVNSNEEINKDDIQEKLEGKGLYVVSFVSGVSEEDEEVFEAKVEVSDSPLYKQVNFRDEDLAKGVVGKVTGKQFEPTVASNGEIESSKEDKPKSESKPENKASENKPSESAENDSKSSDSKEDKKSDDKPAEKDSDSDEKKENDKESNSKEDEKDSDEDSEDKKKSFKESMAKTFVVIDARNNTIVGMYKTEEKANIKAGGFKTINRNGNYIVKPFYEIYNQNYSFSKDLLDRITDHFAESKKLKEAETFNDTMNYLKGLGTKEKYMFLFRMQSDCEYVLGSCKDYWTNDWKDDPSMMRSNQTVANRGLKNSLRHLWSGGNVDNQIAYMRYLYNSLKKKPEWISMEDIDRYEKELKEIENMAESTKKTDKLKEVKLSKMKTVECQLYDYYASYFINGDDSGLSDAELEEVKAIEDAVEAYTGATYCLDVIDNADFGDVEIPRGHRCREFNGIKFLPGDVCTYVFKAPESKKKESVNSKSKLTESKYDKKYNYYFKGLSRSANDDGSYSFSGDDLDSSWSPYSDSVHYSVKERPIVDKHNKEYNDELNTWGNENFDNWVDSSLARKTLKNKWENEAHKIDLEHSQTPLARELSKKYADAVKYRDISRYKGWTNTEKKQNELMDKILADMDADRDKYMIDHNADEFKKAYEDNEAVYNKYWDDFRAIRNKHLDLLDADIQNRRDAISKKADGKDFYSGYSKGVKPEDLGQNGAHDKNLNFYYANGEKDGQKMYTRVGRNDSTDYPFGRNRGWEKYYASADPYEEFESVPESEIDNLKKLDKWDSKVFVGSTDSTG